MKSGLKLYVLGLGVFSAQKEFYRGGGGGEGGGGGGGVEVGGGKNTY